MRSPCPRPLKKIRRKNGGINLLFDFLSKNSRALLNWECCRGRKKQEKNRALGHKNGAFALKKKRKGAGNTYREGREGRDFISEWEYILIYKFEHWENDKKQEIQTRKTELGEREVTE